LGIGDWGLGPIPNPQSPIPNPQSPIPINILINKKFVNKYMSNIYQRKIQKHSSFLKKIIEESGKLNNPNIINMSNF